MNWAETILWIIITLALAASIIAVVVSLIKASPEKRREMINKILFALALEAERLYGSKTGQAKKAQVIAWFYERYSWLSKFVTEKQLGEWIDTVVEAMTDWLASNPVAAANIGLRVDTDTSHEPNSIAAENVPEK